MTLFDINTDAWLVPTIEAGKAVAVAAVTAIATWLVARRKDRPDAIRSLTQSCDLLAMQIKTAHSDLAVSKSTIVRLENEKTVLSKDIDDANDRLVKAASLASALQEQAKIIHESVGALDFVPTGPPTPEDMAAIRRLKTMRESAAVMLSLVEGEE